MDLTRFLSLDYLAYGTARQKAAHRVIHNIELMSVLSPYDPLLAGTIPLDIDVDTSDLDVICSLPVGSVSLFKDTVEERFSKFEGFSIRSEPESLPVVCNFFAEGFEFEIFADNKPSRQQNAFIHMVIEHFILEEKGEGFRQEIIGMKSRGIKTEPAFADLLDLSGDPYRAVIEYGMERYPQVKMLCSQDC